MTSTDRLNGRVASASAILPPERSQSGYGRSRGRGHAARRITRGRRGRPRPVAARRDEGGWGVGDADLDAETVFFEELGQPATACRSSVADLGIGVKIAAIRSVPAAMRRSGCEGILDWSVDA